MLEAEVQKLVRLEASRKGLRLWRNNVGACYDQNGQFIRYGLCNETAAMNRSFKSGDLIGIRPLLITPDHVGKTVGQFVSREIKASDWHLNLKDERQAAQWAWLTLINGMGGDATFATGEGTL